MYTATALMINELYFPSHWPHVSFMQNESDLCRQHMHHHRFVSGVCVMGPQWVNRERGSMTTWETAALMCSSPSWLRCFIFHKKKSLSWHKSPPCEASDHHCPQRYTPGTLLSYNKTKRAAHRQAYNHPVYSVCICECVSGWVSMSTSSFSFCCLS